MNNRYDWMVSLDPRTRMWRHEAWDLVTFLEVEACRGQHIDREGAIECVGRKVVQLEVKAKHEDVAAVPV